MFPYQQHTSALHLAVLNNSTGIVKDLIDAGCDLDIFDNVSVSHLQMQSWFYWLREWFLHSFIHQQLFLTAASNCFAHSSRTRTAEHRWDDPDIWSQPKSARQGANDCWHTWVWLINFHIVIHLWSNNWTKDIYFKCYSRKRHHWMLQHEETMWMWLTWLSKLTDFTNGRRYVQCTLSSNELIQILLSLFEY